MQSVSTAVSLSATQGGLGRALRVAALLLMASVLLLSVGVSVGSSGLDPLLGWLPGAAHDAAKAQIVWDIRLPRSLGAWLAGALLGLAGALAQGLFRNPLADPYLLGSASGASLGVATALAVVGVTPFAASAGAQWLLSLGLTGAAFVGAVGAVLLTLALARGVQHTLRLLLAGVVVSVVLGALSSLVLMLSPDMLLAMQAFMLGSTSFVGWPACVLMAVALLACTALAMAAARVLDALALGEATARSLGLPLGALRLGLVTVMALATGTAVAHTGLIAFVGLAAPHIVRSLVQITHRTLLALSALMGAVLLLAADVLARWLIAPQELPVGVLTAVLGGSYLLWLMQRGQTGLPSSAKLSKAK